jgi:phage tail sheath gpL-like
MSSNAVGTERISRVVGYKIIKGDFSNTTPNLPQRIAILGEANTANQGTVTFDEPKEITSAQQAGEIYGYGSPIHMAMRILRPNAGGVGGIPTIVYSQEEAAGAVANEQTITVTGTADANTTHTVVIGGRYILDGDSYGVNIEDGDTATQVATKITDVINNVLGCPFTASSALGVVTLTAKWAGLTSQDLTVSVDTGDEDAALTYAIAETATGSGTPTLTAALNNFGDDWNTIVLNTYGLVTATLNELETFNGKPDPTTPTGRYTGIIMRPFIAIAGSVADNDTTITDARKTEVTNAVAPAPLSKGHPLEAAANMTVLFANIAQDTPNLDVAGNKYPDMPTPTLIGTMSDYNNRDAYVKKGNSTVTLSSGQYKVEDFVTTYHPVGEVPPQFRYPRNLMIDFNVKFGYYLLQDIYVIDHSISNDDDIVTASNVVKPKTWTAVIDEYADDLSRRALIADAPFMQDSIVVNISGTNPDRLETFFKYKRTGTVRIASTTVQAGFNFGS